MELTHYRQIKKVENSNWWYRGKRIIIAKIIKMLPPRGPDILDVGCGTGAVLKEIGDTLKLNCYGLEPEINFYRVAAARFPKRIYHGDLNRFVKHRPDRFPGRYDLILCVDTLEHIAGDAQALKIFHSLLKPRGKLLLFCPAFSFLWSSLDTTSHHFRRYNRTQLERILTSANFNTTYCTYLNSILFFPIALVRIISHLLKKEILFEATGLKSTPAILNLLFYHLFIIEKFLVPEFSLPLGVSILTLSEKK